jgi:Xaa-Pro aminopeptidase
MIKERIHRLRQQMDQYGIDAYIVPGAEPHQSEYIPLMWQRLQWLSGFTGSAGDAVITKTMAGLWTDFRYHLQAEQELAGTEFMLFKKGLTDVPELETWLKSEFPAGSWVGIDPRLFSYNRFHKLSKDLKSRKIAIKPIVPNLVDQIWQDQPGFPTGLIQPYPMEFSGESIESKLCRLRQKMASEQADVHIITNTDAIAWLYNIRGKDVDFNPVVIAYGAVTQKEALLFVRLNKVTDKVREHLNNLVIINDYDEFQSYLNLLTQFKARVWLDPDTVSQWIVDSLKPEGGCETFFKASPITLFKAIKNDVELAGFRAAHIRDGCAMVRFLAWLQNAVPGGKVTEVKAALKVDQMRAQEVLFQGSSFQTIAAYNEHAAIVHYTPQPKTDITITAPGIFLIDSGGQYLDGTTDITRTIAIGEPSTEQREHFTRVLKGHIQLAMTRFPKGTVGKQLDTLARKYLWDMGLNYGHGTGHGVGHYLNVHEGPQSLTYNRCTEAPLEPGMITSNEPGYYKEGHYGIRIESLVLTIKDNALSSRESDFYAFETLTLCPIDIKLIDKTLLTAQEIAFLNDYHMLIRQTLLPLVDEEAKVWLEQATQPV